MSQTKYEYAMCDKVLNVSYISTCTVYTQHAPNSKLLDPHFSYLNYQLPYLMILFILIFFLITITPNTNPDLYTDVTFYITFVPLHLCFNIFSSIVL